MSKVRSKMIFIEGEPNPQNVKMWEQYKRAKLVAGRSEKTLKCNLKVILCSSLDF